MQAFDEYLKMYVEESTREQLTSKMMFELEIAFKAGQKSRDKEIEQLKAQRDMALYAARRLAKDEHDIRHANWMKGVFND